MKKLAASLALTAALALLPAQAASADILDLTAGVFPDDELAALSSTGDPFAVGGGTAGTLHFAFSAHLGPNGPSGYAVVRDPSLGEAQGDVVCYRETVPGHQVVFYIEKKKGSGFFGSRAFVGIFAQDSGAAPPSGDFLLANPSFSVGSCVLDGGLGGSVTQGNIVVK
jgi:hypothetical protein